MTSRTVGGRWVCIRWSCTYFRTSRWMSVKGSSEGAKVLLLAFFWWKRIRLYTSIRLYSKSSGKGGDMKGALIPHTVPSKNLLPKAPAATTSYEGHRGRLREKFASAGAAALRDYELLELLLSFSIPRRDTKPYAKKLLAAFQNVRCVLEADLTSLQTLGGLPSQSALHLKAIGDLHRLAAREEFKRGRVISSPDDVALYLRDQIGSRPREGFTFLFLH